MSSRFLIGRVLVGMFVAVGVSCGPTASSKLKSGTCRGKLIEGVCLYPNFNGKDSDWHLDPDGDGVGGDNDVCPYVYDPDQSDVDSDGIGDSCDPDFVEVIENGPVVDLRAEHVSPYGGWFSFTSPETTLYGRDYVLSWSTDQADVETASGVEGLDDSQKSIFRSYSYVGHQVTRPVIVTSMEPNTTYFIGVRPLNDSKKPSNKDGNIIEIKTSTPPELNRVSTNSRVWATQEQLQSLADRHRNGDEAWQRWSQKMGSSALNAGSGTEIWDFEECIGAALLFHATGDSGYRDSALSLIQTMLSHWQGNDLKHNALRWADSNLPICADLMWGELSGGERNEIVSAYLEDDEDASIERMADTDEYASIVRTWVVDGLIACEAPGIDSELSTRGCELLERGLRAFYGVQLVKARRQRGYFAQSGGGLPDGTGYGRGTSTYWLKTLHALTNMGADLDRYSVWVWRNFLSTEIYPLTPRRRGYATYGDLDSYDNFSTEPNSLPLQKHLGGMVAMQMGLMAQSGLNEQAGFAKQHLETMFPDDNSGSSWAMLLFDHDGIDRSAMKDGISSGYFDPGMGQFYDRSSWNEDASFFVFRAGWTGVDHTHEDAGSFQLYRNGVWLTHEALGYDGPARSASGHNVPALEIDFEGKENRVGQFWSEGEAPARIQGLTSQPTYAFVSADLTGAYTSGRYHSFNYDTVERQILWLKPTNENRDDRLVIYDRIDSAADASMGTRALQIHADTQPSVDGASARFDAGSRVSIDVVVPADLVLDSESPRGVHSQYPGQIYTNRLVANANNSEKKLRYVSVLRATDSDESISAIGVESDQVVGAVSGSDLVIFQRIPEARVSEAQSVQIVAPGVTAIWWTGLEPGAKYSVDSNQGGGRFDITLRPGGVLQADEAGVVVVAL